MLFFLILILEIKPQLICNINNIEYSIKISNNNTISQQNCSLNLTSNSITDLNSLGGNLTLFGTQINIDQPLSFYGFDMIMFNNIDFIVLQSSLISSSNITFQNVTFYEKLNITAPQINLINCSIIDLTLQNEELFHGEILINNLQIINSTFLNCSLFPNNSLIQNLNLQNINFINSTLGSFKQLVQIFVNNSYFVQSQFVITNKLENFNIQNSYLFWCQFIKSQQVTNFNALNIKSGKSQLLILENEYQINISQIRLESIESDNFLIAAQTQNLLIQYLIINNISITYIIFAQSETLIFSNINLLAINGGFVKSSTKINFYLYNFSCQQCVSKTLFNCAGLISIIQASFNQLNSSFINSNTTSNLILDQVEFNNISGGWFIQIMQAQQILLTNLLLRNINELKFGLFGSIQSIMIQNLTLQNSKNVQLFNIISSSISLDLIQFQSIINQNSIIIINNSSSLYQNINVKNINLNSSLIQEQNNLAFTMQDSSYSNIICNLCEGILLFQLSQELLFNNIKFVNLTSQNGIVKVENANVISIQNNVFSNIVLTSEGIFVINNSSISLNNNVFNKISASQGGILYFIEKENNELNIYDNEINNAVATFGNFAYINTNNIINQEQDYFIQGPIYIFIFNQTLSLYQLITNNLLISLENCKSGETIMFSISIKNSQNQSICNLSEPINFNNENILFSKNNCAYLLSYTYYQDNPINQSIIQNIIINQFQYQNQVLNISINFNFVECNIGEQWVDQRCSLCQNGTYSMKKQEHCILCPQEANECFNGSLIALKSGYWRANNLSEEIEKCSPSFSKCEGGYDNFTCGNGYTGALCQDCDNYENFWTGNYARSLSFTCEQCTNNIQNYIQIVLILLWIFLLLFYSVNRSLRLIFAQLQGHYLRLAGLHFGAKSIIDHTEVLMKMISTYFQLLSILLVLNIQIPQPFQFFSQFIGNPIQTFTTSIQCLLLRIPTDINLIYLVQFGNVIVTIILLIVLILYFIVKQVFQKNYRFLCSFCMNIFVQIQFYCQGDLLEGLFQSLFCFEASGKYYIQASPQFECYTSEHLYFIKVFLIPMISLIGLVLPILYQIKVLLKRKNLWKPSIRISYGFLFVEYKNQLYYWENLRCTVKFIFYILATVLISNFKLLYLLTILILLLYEELTSEAQPFLEKKFNQLDKLSSQIQTLTLVLAFILEENKAPPISTLIELLISTFNFIFLIYFLWKFFSEIFREHKRRFKDYALIILNRFSLFQNCIKQIKSSSMPDRSQELWKKARIHVYKFIALAKEAKEPQQSQQTNQEEQINKSSQNLFFSELQPSLINSIKPSLVKYVRHFQILNSFHPINKQQLKEKSNDQLSQPNTSNTQQQQQQQQQQQVINEQSSLQSNNSHLFDSSQNQIKSMIQMTESQVECNQGDANRVSLQELNEENQQFKEIKKEELPSLLKQLKAKKKIVKERL